MPANQFVFGFIGLSNFLPVEIEEGAIWIEGAKNAGPVNATLPPLAKGRRLTLATRPSEIDFVHEGGVRGIVKRLAYLGDIIDYRVLIGDVEVRIQKNRKREIFREGEPCGLTFNKVLWYERDL
jgi:iron(III) transport system ATP-binding protein